MEGTSSGAARVGGLLSAGPPSGHRANQLRVAASLVERYATPGRLLDVGTGTGWLPRAWTAGVSIGIDLVTSPSWKGGHAAWVTASADALPFRQTSFDTVTAIGVLGAFDRRVLWRVAQEIARVLASHGRLIILVSRGHFLYDLLAPHRIISRWRWRSFDSGSLSNLLEGAGLTLFHMEAHGGWRTLLAEWLVFLLRIFQRYAFGAALQRRAGELDRVDFRRHARGSRYLYLVFTKSDGGEEDVG